MEPQLPPPEPTRPLDETHIDSLLALHATRRPGPVRRHLGTVLVTAVLLIGAATFGIVQFAARQAAIPDTTRLVVDVSPLPADAAEPTPDPNAALPAAAQAARAEWPLSAPRTVAFKPGTATPVSVTESEALYTAVSAYAARNPSLTITLTAFTTPDDTANGLAAFRLEYLASQFAENGLTRPRLVQSTQTVDAFPSAEYADAVHIGRSPFDGEQTPQ